MIQKVHRTQNRPLSYKGKECSDRRIGYALVRYSKEQGPNRHADCGYCTSALVLCCSDGTGNDSSAAKRRHCCRQSKRRQIR